MSIATAPTFNLSSAVINETRHTRETKQLYHYEIPNKLPHLKDIIGVTFTIVNNAKVLEEINHEVWKAFMNAVDKRNEVLGAAKNLIVEEGMKLVKYLSLLNYQKVRVEILPEDSIIFRLDIEPGLQIIITKYYYDQEALEGRPLISIVQDNEIVFHNRVPIGTFVEKMRSVLV